MELLEREGRGLNLTQEVVDGIRCHSGGLRAMTAEGRVVGLADRVAYVAHDIDDAKRAGLLCEEDLPTDACEVLGHSSSERIERMVRDVVERTEATGEVGMTPEVWRSMMGLRSFLFANIYSKGEAKWEEPKASRLLEELFSHFCAHLDEVPGEYRLHDADAPEVQVADFVSGMTDRYAIKTYEELFVPRVWSVS